MPGNWDSIIKSVTTPLGFFVLIVLLVEAIFGFSAYNFIDERTIIVIAMIILIFVLVGIVAFLSYSQPEALSGQRYSEDPEIAKMRERFMSVEHIADKVVGEWEFVTRYQQEGQAEAVEVRGTCHICKSLLGITMQGIVKYGVEQKEASFDVKQAFLNEDSLTYIYSVPMSIGRSVLGVGEVRFFNEGSTVNHMKGNWAVLGIKIGGEAEFKRKS